MSEEIEELSKKEFKKSLEYWKEFYREKMGVFKSVTEMDFFEPISMPCPVCSRFSIYFYRPWITKKKNFFQTIAVQHESLFCLRSSCEYQVTSTHEAQLGEMRLL
jgi:hypothetical protein